MGKLSHNRGPVAWAKMLKLLAALADGNRWMRVIDLQHVVGNNRTLASWYLRVLTNGGYIDTIRGGGCRPSEYRINRLGLQRLGVDARGIVSPPPPHEQPRDRCLDSRPLMRAMGMPLTPPVLPHDARKVTVA